MTLPSQRLVSSLLKLPLGFLFHKPDLSVQVNTNAQLFSLRGPVVHMLTVGQPLNRLTGKVKLHVCLGRGIESVQSLMNSTSCYVCTFFFLGALPMLVKRSEV